MNNYSTIRVGVAGATGYAGLELIKRLARHPAVDLRLAMASSAAETRRLPALARIWDGAVQPFALDRLAGEADIVFLAVPDTLAAEAAPALASSGVRVLDLSGAFRLRDPELRRRWYPHSPDVGVRVAYRAQDVEKEPQPLFRCQPIRVTPAVDPLTFDVLDDEVWLSVFRDAGIEEPCDVRMVQPSQQAPLTPEAGASDRIEERQVEQLDGSRALEAAVAPPGEPDGAHPTLPQRTLEGPGTQSLAREPTHRLSVGTPQTIREKAMLLDRCLCLQQALQLCGMGRLPAPEAGEPRRSLRLGKLERLVQQPLEGSQQREICRGHGWSSANVRVGGTSADRANLREGRLVVKQVRA